MKKIRYGAAAVAILLCVLVRDLKRISLFLALALLICLAADFLEERQRKKELQELTDYLTKVQDYASLPEMQKITEGQIGILQSEIYKVVTILKEEYFSEHRQKKYISDMMSDISHQFKTPLTAISLMAELLLRPEVKEEDRLEYASKINTEVSKMTWLIRNLLTLSQLEAGVLEMKTEKLVLRALIRGILDSLEIMAEVAEVELGEDISEEILIKADRHWMSEAISNIIKNCIEHTPAGGFVRISARQNNLSAEIEIRDSGKGIEEQHLPHIFERFYKAGNTSKNSVGIGLAISKQIVNAHGGTIEVQSEAGRGSVFTIRLYEM